MKLEKLMLLQGHTQRSLAKAAGVSDTTINFIINGKGNVTRATNMKKIADALGVGIAEIDEFAAAIDAQLGKGLPATGISDAGRNNTAVGVRAPAAALIS